MTRRTFAGTVAGSLTASTAGRLLGGGRALAAARAAFPPGFIWGTATAAYQVEGAIKEDGRGPDIWDRFVQKPGAIWMKNTAAIACDHYHRYREDIALMKSLGMPSYRFSVSWPRVFPEGTGTVNARGMDHYDRLVDELLRAGIDPWLMLYHWDLPLALQDRGGWMNRDIAGWFADYAAAVTERLSDRCTNIMTIEEPAVFIGMGLFTGEHAPGEKRSFGEFLQAAHHALLAHGRGVQAIRAHAKKKARVGFAISAQSFRPATNKPADIEATRLRTFTALPDQHMSNVWWTDPALLGHYPEDSARSFGAAMPKFASADMAIIHQPIDFLGVNIYNCRPIRAIPQAPHWEAVTQSPEQALTGSGWLMSPEGAYWIPKFMHERYHVPLMITENGTSVHNWVSLDGKVHDPERIDCLTRYLQALAQSMKDGANVIGYHLWSLIDNFEWAEGYKERFGLVYVNYETQQRIPKDSARWYQQVVASNGATLFGGAESKL